MNPREPRNRASAGGRGGFTLIELLLVVVIVGILAQIAIPNYRALTVKARAASLVGDIEVVEQAARSYQADLHSWPSNSPVGTIPAGMAPYLPEGFSFTGEDFELDWENIAVPGGLPGRAGVGRLLGVGIVTVNSELGEALVELLGDSGWYLIGNRYIRIIDRQ